MEKKEYLKNIFTYHAPKEGQPEKYELIRGIAKNMAIVIENECPESIEKDEAIKKLRETVMWANASIAINS